MIVRPIGSNALHRGCEARTRRDVVGSAHYLVVDEGWFNGPPYALLEIVFDEDGIQEC